MINKKLLDSVYYLFLVILFAMFIGQYTLFKPEIINEYERCYTCMNGEKQYLCDCEEIQEKESQALSGWYIAIYLVMGVYVTIYAFLNLLNMQKRKIRT